jgi:hypothetical protein
VKLSLRSVGGVTGPAGAVTRTVDVSTLPPEERAKTRALLDAARPFDQPERLLSKAPHSWDFRHTLTVEDDGRTHKIDLHLDAAPPALRALVEWMEDREPDQSR